MSRVIVKNLPKKATAEQVREAFEAVSQVTDVRLLNDPETGKFRGVAFVGLHDTDAGEKAIKYFQKAYIGTCRVTVEAARPCKDPALQPLGKKHKPVPQNPKWEEFQSMIQGKTPDGEKKTNTDLDSTRLFLRNLSYSVTKEEIQTAFEPFGPIEEVTLPLDSVSLQPKGFAYVKFESTESAVEALGKLDGSVFQGRLLHIIPAWKKPDVTPPIVGKSSFKAAQTAKLKEKAQNDSSWNTLFLNQDAVAAAASRKLHLKKGEFLDRDSDDLAVRLSAAETQVLEETKEWMKMEGINLESFQQNRDTCPRSKRILIVKNLAGKAAVAELSDLFGRYGALGRVCVAPSRTVAIVEYANETHAKNAFERLAYAQYQHLPLYLEYAPIHTFEEEAQGTRANPKDESENVEAAETSTSTVFVKNFNFETTEEAAKTHFSQIGSVSSVRFVKNGGLPCGYGFVQFASEKEALKAISNLNNEILDGHALKLSLSKKGEERQKRQREVEPEGSPALLASSHLRPGTKILIKNLPFEATKSELRTLFQAYGQVKTVRIPKKYSGGHRGFAFVDFVSQDDALRAFSSLQNTHLYARKLVLQWAEMDESVASLRKKVG